MDFDAQLDMKRNGNLKKDTVLEQALGALTDGSIQTFTQVLKIVPNGVFIYMQPKTGDVKAALQIGEHLCKIDNFARLEPGSYPFLDDPNISLRLNQYMHEDMLEVVKLFKKHKKKLPDKIWIGKNNEWLPETEEYTPPTKNAKRTTFGYCGPSGASNAEDNFNNWRYSLEDKGWQSLTHI